MTPMLLINGAVSALMKPVPLVPPYTAWSCQTLVRVDYAPSRNPAKVPEANDLP